MQERGRGAPEMARAGSECRPGRGGTALNGGRDGCRGEETQRANGFTVGATWERGNIIGNSMGEN